MTLAHEVAGTKGLKTPFTNSKGQSARNITSEEYGTVIKETLLPGGRRLFSQGGGLASWTYQQDNDPSHKLASSHINAWNTLHGSSVKLLPNWPLNLPDLNTVQNAGVCTEAKINATGCKTLGVFKAMVHKICKEVPLTMMENMYSSKPKRMRLVVEKGGEKTGY